MSFPARRTPDLELPGRTVTLRAHREPDRLIASVEPGDLVLLRQRDPDAGLARSLAARRPAAVVSTAELISGRFANLGPQVFAEAGIPLFEADAEQLTTVSDGQVLRWSDRTLYDGAVVVADLRPITPDDVRVQMQAARGGMLTQLETLAHSTSELLRREEDLFLHGTGLPELRTAVRGRSVVVIGPQSTAADLKKIRRFVAEQRPVIVAVDAGAATATGRRFRADVLVLTNAVAAGEKAFRRASEVVAVNPDDALARNLERRNLATHRVETAAAPVDIALVLAGAAGARLVVVVGAPAGLDEFLDRGRRDQPGHILSRLRLQGRLVDAAAVPLLYTGRVRRRHLAASFAAALAVFVFTLAMTPKGQDAWDSFRAAQGGSSGISGWLSERLDQLREPQ